jgi:hypothetical protein
MPINIFLKIHTYIHTYLDYQLQAEQYQLQHAVVYYYYYYYYYYYNNNNNNNNNVYWVQPGPGAHPASYTMGIGSFLGLKRPGRGVDHPPHLSPRLKIE